MKDNVSPEEKLLKLIKGEKKTKPPSNLAAQDVAIDKKITSDISDLKPAIKNPLHSFVQTYLTFTNIQRLIPALLVVSTMYLFASLIYPWVGLNKIKLPDVSLEKTKEPEFKPKEEPKPFEFYLQGISQHKIFGNPRGSGSNQETVIPTGVAEADLIKDISLVGIISGLTPQAIIEDKKAQKTYYVIKGQFIGEIQVEDILEGKIIINLKGKRFELYL